MNTLDILAEFNNERNFVGVFPRDKIPNVSQRPCGLIINIDKSDEPGSHWVAIYLDGAMGEYFDSFGRMPEHTEIIHFLRLQCPGGIRYNSIELQSRSSIVCGHHCIFYLRMRFNGQSFPTTLNFLSQNNPIFNDFMVSVYK
jgi:hypothetical protein